MNGPQTFERLSQQSLEEHQQIHFHVGLLRNALEGLESAAVDAESLLNLAARIESLRERLHEHFAQEAEGGLFRALVDAMPQVESDVRRIQGEHDRISADLESARTLALGKDPANAAFLRSELERILKVIAAHERDEDDLVRRALEQE